MRHLSKIVAIGLLLLGSPSWGRPALHATPSSVVNLRDVGGKRGQNGACIKRGLVFRSAHFAHTTAADGATLVHDLGLRIYYDLRSPWEIDTVGGAPALVQAGVQWQRLPIDCSDDPFLRGRAARTVEAWSNFYLRMFDRYGSTFAGLVGDLAGGQVPAVYGCSLGKDRTGIVTALFLSVLGVSDDAVLADYAASTAALEPHAEVFVPFFHDAPVSRATFVQAAITADPAIMAGFLAGIRARFGTIEAALRAHGLSPATLAALRQRYLVELPEGC